MANVTLKNLAKQFNDKTPTNVDDLKKYQTNKEILYKDLKLDITNIKNEGIVNSNVFNAEISMIDLEASTNIEAIKNSLLNWLNTSEGLRLINPELGVNLHSYLFAQLDEYSAYFLGLEITERLSMLEPRIKIETCNIALDFTNDAYQIELVISVPSLNNTIISLKGILNSDGYTII